VEKKTHKGGMRVKLLPKFESGAVARISGSNKKKFELLPFRTPGHREQGESRGTAQQNDRSL
jgi:hypothetical protein